MRPTSRAIVLGSGQHPRVVNAPAAHRRNLTVLRRRSGGGIVLVSLTDLLWVDVLVPRDDSLWEPDVGRAFAWLGHAWRRALDNCGVAAEVYDGGYQAGSWGSLVCFAGRGPGEVFWEGRKVVGLSQKRSRDGARFQCGVPLRWEPSELVELLEVPAGDRAPLERHLAVCAGSLGIPADRLLEAFVETLPLVGVRP